MNRCCRFACALLGGLCAISVVYGASSDEPLLKLVANLKQMTEATKEPVEINERVSTLCRPPSAPNHSRLIASKTAVIRVYVTPEGAKAMREPDGVFPQGAVVLKQKFTSPEATQPELYTGMLKREPGYNPACGDWEFFTVSGDGKTVTARGRLDSCMACHKDYRRTDFISQKYP